MSLTATPKTPLDAIMVPYTPVSAVSAGDVVVRGNLPCVAHRAIPAAALGAVAVQGCTYTMPKSATQAISDGNPVYWDATNTICDTRSSVGQLFGFAIGAATSSATSFLAYHQPGK